MRFRRCRSSGSRPSRWPWSDSRCSGCAAARPEPGSTRVPGNGPWIHSIQGRFFEKLKLPRSTIPAVTHVDHSARIETVRDETQPELAAVLREFEKLTGCPVLVNTSFNVRGEPIVCTPEDSYRCFMRTEIDALALETRLLLKPEQPAFAEAGDWRSDFALD